MSDEQATRRPTPADIAASPPLPASYTQDPVLADGSVVSSYGRRFLAALLELVLAVVTLGIGYLVWSLFTWGRGQTPGKQVMRMRVVEVASGRPFGWGMMFVREFLLKGILLSFFSAISVGILWLVAVLLILAGDLHQTAWDRLLRSTVADKPVTR